MAAPSLAHRVRSSPPCDVTPPATTDLLVVGAGVVGLTVALELKRRRPDLTVTLIDKEARLGLHASGRNSGILHAGFYYSADSLKARFTREGNRALTAYCLERGLRINRCGKLVAARNAADREAFDELLQRAQANDVELHLVTIGEAREIEPRITTFEHALYSPTTASIDPAEVVASLAADARAAGVVVCTGTPYLTRRAASVQTSHGAIGFGYLVNAAGLHADRIAHGFGFGRRYRILPFKGLYLHAQPDSPPFRTNIYPVPDLDRPFLGVHITVTVSGHAKLGPTALPALWREHYSWREGFNLREFLEIAWREGAFLLRNDFAFRTLASQELRKARRPHLVRLGGELATGVRPDHFRRWGQPGIRAQLVDIRERRLEMDFRCEGDDRSFHILNAVSPAFTCALPFAAHVVDHIEALSRI